MTRASVREYIQAVRERYRRADRRGKGKILDEAMRVTGYHRKSLLRLLRRRASGGAPRRPGRPRRYGPAAVEALRTVWEATDRLCSRRLQPFLPEVLRILQRHGEQELTVETRAQVLQMSPATVDRRLRPYRNREGRRRCGTTRPGSLLKSAIPIRTFADWDETGPGFLEVDLVAHCGESTEGFYLHTLTAVDVATGWVDCQGVWGKGQERVGSAIHHLSQRLPFPLRGLDSDNGSEFINQGLYDYCQRHKITFTRSRPYKKNDSAHVEQKNWTAVRRLVGYDRYSSKEALERLNRLYELARLYGNFFQPVMKLQHKTRHGARVHKVYDRTQTPYQRLLAAEALSVTKQKELAASYARLNPVALLRQINQGLEQLWTLADPQGRARPSDGR